MATYNGIKWFFSAYDMDTTFGVNWNGEEWYSGERSSVLISHYAKSHNLMGLIKKYKKEALTKRYKELMKGALSFDNVCNVFENFISKISSGLYEEDI